MDSLVLSRWMLNAALVPALPVALLQLLTSHPADRNSSIQLQDEENAERRKETRRAEKFYQRKKEEEERNGKKREEEGKSRKEAKHDICSLWWSMYSRKLTSERWLAF